MKIFLFGSANLNIEDNQIFIVNIYCQYQINIVQQYIKQSERFLRN